MWSRRFRDKMNLQGHGLIFNEDKTIPNDDEMNLLATENRIKQSNKQFYSEIMF